MEVEGLKKSEEWRVESEEWRVVSGGFLEQAST